MCNDNNNKIYKLNGQNFDDFDGFIRECNHSFIHEFGGNWSGNLDAFNDFLAWSDVGIYTLRWLNSDKSRHNLGYSAMVDWLSGNLERCLPSNRKFVRKRLRAAQNSMGQTLFDLIVEIIKEHHPYVLLELK